MKHSSRIKNYFDSAEASIIPLDDAFVPSTEQLKQIVTICNSEPNYSMLFKEKKGAKPYTAEDAAGFISWAQRGWSGSEYFVFLILEDGRIAGAVDIKSASKDASEIGYWSNPDRKGFMTAAVTDLCSIARSMGYQKLYALVRTHNSKSANVLERAGFVRDNESVVKDGSDYFRYSKQI
ncbi:MAG: hypothetical protein TR69_WS6001000678 [candidate division WS6 bacterium OLB20]|uniref:N-acetyltransferase domain-containing protein n=1 Tax=candidate division WS6 bacterium OLB20 TaxID=1617426 RepID=A0A136LYD6_9BACT|nr:MAG: hypothetical protein TR69_WS6001000678 [candidate division WS6 bacterium OLB20]